MDVPSEFLSPLYSCVSFASGKSEASTDYFSLQFGEAYLRNRILSHADVGRRWYPELYEKYSKQDLK